MRALLTPYLQRDLGLVVLKPGRDLLPLFSSGRLLLSHEPDEFKGLPSGLLPAADQSLANDPQLQPFFLHERVISAAGGALVSWLESISACQFHDPDGYHNLHLTTLKSGPGAVRLCWHHDNKLREQSHPQIEALASANIAAYVIEKARINLSLPQTHQLSLPELCWWANISGLIDLLPDAVARRSLKWSPSVLTAGEVKEVDIVPTRPAVDVLEELAEQVKSVLVVDVDPEPPAGFMLRPKMKRWECEKYTRWVKSQACCCGCGRPADDPHHIIDQGFGGTGTKPHDIFTIPLTRQCHDELHRDVAGWETKHGSQLLHLARTLDRAYGLGVIVTANKRGAKV